ncbi:hypothetical protein KJ359_006809 [Pestalotiopsis sp. 9143b]|nr:hypothetical protein KJ359_006809 [Pestalotiopsis sp. 9143b]
MESIQEALELMVQGQATIYQDSTPESDTVERWAKLFSYTHTEAQDKIQQSRNDLNRTTITIGHWDMIRDQKEAEGHDKESYEHYLDISKQARQISRHTSSLPTMILAKPKPARFLLKLDGPLSDITIIQQAANLSRLPKLRKGTDDSGHPVRFCEIDSLARDQITAFAQQNTLSYNFATNILPDRTAEKNLSPDSLHPTLGVESTLPQFRGADASPHNDEYPVWYFFYGTLADPDILTAQTGVEEPRLIPAHISGGVLKTWGGKYNALVDQRGYGKESKVAGHAFCVESEKVETGLRVYETNKYEVVRCTIEMEGRRRKGLTFRFVGNDALDQ